MISLVNYCEEKYSTTEVKFNNLDNKDVEYYNELLKSVIEDKINSWQNDRIDTNIKYGEKCYVEFDNPFADYRKFSSSSKQLKRIENENKTIRCIGIVDKFGRIFLQNIWETNNPAYIEYNKPEIKKTKAGKSYSTKAGWCLTRKDIECYKVSTLYSKTEKCIMYIPQSFKRKGVWGISIDIKYIKKIE